MCRNFLHMSGTSSHHTVCTSTQKYCHLKAKQKVQVFVVTRQDCVSIDIKYRGSDNIDYKK